MWFRTIGRLLSFATLGVLLGQAAGAANWDSLRAAARTAGPTELGSLVARLDTSLASAQSPTDLALGAEVLGEFVDRARAVDASLQTFRSLSGDAVALGDRIDSARERFEDRAGEDEAALEKLYRSEDWRRLDYADVLRRYWNGWAQLAVGQRESDARRRKAAFESAERAFARARIEVSLPRVATLSLLGTAMAKRELGENTSARRALEQFEAQATRLGQDDLLAPALFEAALIALQEGDVARADAILQRVPPGALNLEQRRGITRMRLEALVDRAEAGDTSAAARAAESLRTLLSKGGEDADFATQFALTHRATLTGQDLGTLGGWMRAEAAFSEERYAQARDLYAGLLAGGGAVRGVDVHVARYKYASAIYQAGGDRRAALRALDSVLSSGPRDLRAPASRLAFALAAAEHAERGAAESEQRLRNEARRLLRNDPAAPAADQAKLWLAQSGGGNEAALLSSVSRKSSAYPAALSERVRRRAGDLQRRANRGRRVPAGEARALLSDIDELFALVREGRLEANPSRDVELRVLAAKASDWAGEASGRTLDRVAAAEALDLDSGQERALLRVRLSAWARGGAHDRALRQFAAATDRAVATDYPIWREAADRLRDAKLPAPDQVEMRERLLRLAPSGAQPVARLEYAKALSRSRRGEEALAQAETLLRGDEDWGEPALLRARLLTRLGRTEEATEAWHQIALGVEEGTPLWAEAQAQRGLAAEKSGALEEACAVVEELARPEWQDASWTGGRLFQRLDGVRTRCRGGEAEATGGA